MYYFAAGVESGSPEIQKIIKKISITSEFLKLLMRPQEWE